MPALRILHDPLCAGYGLPGHPERPLRVEATVPVLQARHPDWTWDRPASAPEQALLRAHSTRHLRRLEEATDFDADTPFLPGIGDHARRAAGGALAALEYALKGEKAFSLMRPPGHHATQEEAMGFCYLNSVAVAALEARTRGVSRVAVWDFDAHHGNGTEAILRQQAGCLYVSVHQSPGYPGTGQQSVDNCRNFPVAPGTSRTEHLKILERSWQEVNSFRPELVLVSAGFDAYEDDPLTVMTLMRDDFAALGSWLNDAGVPAAAVLEGGYSTQLPWLIDAFLSAWAGKDAAS